MAWRKLFGIVITQGTSHPTLGWYHRSFLETAENRVRNRNQQMKCRRSGIFPKAQNWKEYVCQRLSQNIHQNTSFFWEYSIVPGDLSGFFLDHKYHNEQPFNWQQQLEKHLCSQNSTIINYKLHPSVTSLKPKTLVKWSNNSEYVLSFPSSDPLRIAMDRVMNKHAPHLLWSCGPIKQVTVCP